MGIIKQLNSNPQIRRKNMKNTQTLSKEDMLLWKNAHFGKVNWRLVNKQLSAIKAEKPTTDAEEFIIESLVPSIESFRSRLFEAKEVEDNPKSSRESKLFNVELTKHTFANMMFNIRVASIMSSKSVKNYGMLVRLSAVNHLLRAAYN